MQASNIDSTDASSGLIKTNHHVYYCDDDVLSLSVVLPHSLKAYWEGNADAYLVFRYLGMRLLMT